MCISDSYWLSTQKPYLNYGLRSIYSFDINTYINEIDALKSLKQTKISPSKL